MNFGAPKVHKGVHRYALRMVELHRDARGNYVARKRLPDGVGRVRAPIRRLLREAKKTWPASTERKLVERLFHEWLADVEAKLPQSKQR